MRLNLGCEINFGCNGVGYEIYVTGDVYRDDNDCLACDNINIRSINKELTLMRFEHVNYLDFIDQIGLNALEGLLETISNQLIREYSDNHAYIVADANEYG